MKSFSFLTIFPILFVVASCASSPQERIARDSAAYQKLTLDEQVKVSHGKLAQGMSPEAVRLAWGDPDKVVQSGQGGKVVDKWLYKDGGYSFSLGVGGGSGWASRDSVSAVGAGVLIPLGGEAPRARAVVSFVNGKVQAWEGEP